MQPSTLPSKSSLFLAANQSAPSFTKAVYVKPDLLEVVKHDGVNLTTNQQALLFCMLSNHDAVFQGRKGPASQATLATRRSSTTSQTVCDSSQRSQSHGR